MHAGAMTVARITRRGPTVEEGKGVADDELDVSRVDLRVLHKGVCEAGARAAAREQGAGARAKVGSEMEAWWRQSFGRGVGEATTLLFLRVAGSGGAKEGRQGNRVATIHGVDEGGPRPVRGGARPAAGKQARKLASTKAGARA